MAFPGGTLSVGCIENIVNNGYTDAVVMQVLDVRKITSKNAAAPGDRFRLTLNDSQHVIPAMLTTQLNDLVNNGSIMPKCVIRITEYVCNSVPGRTAQTKLIVILSVEPLSPPLSGSIGSPTEFGAGATPAPPTPQDIPASAGQSMPKPLAPTATPNSGSTPFQDPTTGHTIVPIKMLDTYLAKWTIRARCASKGELKPYNSGRSEGRLFSMTLLDESGEIRVTCYNDAADKWYPFFSQGEMYVISQGKLKFANKKFTSVKHAYEMTLNADSMVIPIQGVETVPLIHFDIVPIDHLEDAKKDDMVDVCGVVISSKPVATITTKRGETAKRSILLGDSSGRTIELTLWGTHALEFDEVLASAPHPVLAVKGARVSDFGGKTLSAVQSSEFEVNPQVPAAFNAQNWFNSLPNQGRDVPSLSGGGSGGGGGGMGGGKEKTLAAIASENLGHNSTPDYITVPNIYITSFKRDAATLWYKACSKPECKGRKVEERGVGNFACPTCGSVNSYKLRWVSNFTGFDHTGREWISGFGEAGSIILGCEPESIADLDRGEAKFLQTFDDPRYRSYNMKLAVKSELWNDTPRIKVSVQSITPVNYVTDSTRLISRIQELTK